MTRGAANVPCSWPSTGLLLFVLSAVPASAQPRDDEGRREYPPRRERSRTHDDRRQYDEQRQHDDRGRHDEQRERDDRRHYDERYIDYQSEPPSDYYERHWRREIRDYGRARDRFDRRYRGRGSRYYRRGGRYTDDGRYGYYGRGYDYGYGYGDWTFGEGYWEGRRDGRRYAEWERRYELGRRAYADAMSDGLLAFRNGDYSQAVRHFVRAAKTNQGAAASRIHAAHAMVAIGRYHEALPALRRAFQLQPKIAYLALDIRRDYGRKADLDAHVKELAGATREAQDDPALWLLLGYYQFYSGREAAAIGSLNKVDELAPGDFMTDALLDAARMISPPARQRPKAEHSPKLKRGPKPERPGKSKANPGHDV